MNKIISCSTYARGLLRRAQGGTVHSVYRKTANLRVGDGLLSLQARGTPASPLTLETDLDAAGFAALALKRGMEASFCESGLYLNGAFFDISCVELWEGELRPAEPLSAQRAAESLRRAAPRGGFADLALPEGERWRNSAPACEAESILRRSGEQLRSGERADAARTLTELVGLGEGLTPSGDDFLCGVLAATWLGGGRQGDVWRGLLAEPLRARLCETNDISAAFLSCALQGQFSRPVTELPGMSPAAAAASFRAIGHSSGVDTLNGILYGLRLLEAEKSA